MHLSSAQSRSAWTEQEDDLLRAAVKKYGDRAWATVANDVPGRSSKSCSDRWRNFLSPDIEHPRKSPFSEWEVAVVVQAQHRYGNNWKAISMLLPGRTNRAVKNLFVGNLKWGARLPEIQNRYLEIKTPLEDLLEITPDYPGGPPKERPGLMLGPGAHPGSFNRGSASPTSLVAASTSSAGSAWASEVTEQQLQVAGGPGATMGSRLQLDPQRLRRPREGSDSGSPSVVLHSPESVHKRLRTGSTPQMANCARSGDAGAVPAGLAVSGLMSGMSGMPTFGSDMLTGGLTPIPLAIGAQYSHHTLQHPPHLQALQPPQHSFCSASPSPTSAVTAAAASPQPISPASDHTNAGLTLRGTGSAAGLGGDGHPLLLQGHASNDSVMLASIMDTLLDDDELLSDPAMGQHLLGSPTASPLLHTGISGGGGAAPHMPTGVAASGWSHSAIAAPKQEGSLGMCLKQDAQQSAAAAAHSSDWWLGPQLVGAVGQGPQATQQQPQQQPQQQAQQQQQQQQQQQPQMMRALCAQLKQENMLLMQQVQSLQTRLAGAPALADTDAVALPAL